MNDDAKLIARLNRSDRKSFEQLYDKYVKIVYRFLLSVLNDAHLAEDLTQWSFMQLWEHRRCISSEKNLPAWLYVIARNAAYKELRRQLKAAHYVEYASFSKERYELLPTSSSEIRVIVDEMSSVIADLPEARKKIFLMRTEEKLSVSDIAEVLGISPKTVETQIARAKLALRRRASELLFLAIVVTFAI